MSKEKTLTFTVYAVELGNGHTLFEAAFGNETHLRDSARDLGSKLAGHCKHAHDKGVQASILFSNDYVILTGGDSQEHWHMYRQRPLNEQERKDLWIPFRSNAD